MNVSRHQEKYVNVQAPQNAIERLIGSDETAVREFKGGMQGWKLVFTVVAR
jgi:hypothetical protein